MTPLARAALWYGRHLRWPVFPIKPRAKAPPLIEAWPERATNELDIIAAWWSVWPNANVGLHCADLLVLDVDPRHDGPASLATLLDSHGRLSPTAVQRTPGGGWHYLYRCAAPIKNAGHRPLGSGLDVKTKGGYIALAPSVRPDGAYRWASGCTPWLHGLADAPAWLVRLLSPPEKPPPRPPTAPLTETSDRLVAFALSRDLEAVRIAPKGTRNHCLYAKARALARFDLNRADLASHLIDAATHAGLSESEAAATVNSAFRSRTAT
jgi:hypothetical protein